MRIYILLTTLLSILYSKSQAQNSYWYNHLDTTTTWIFDDTQYGPMGGYGTIREQFTFEGDSILDGVSYKKVYAIRTEGFGPHPPTPAKEIHNLEALIRIEDGRIYRHNQSTYYCNTSNPNNINETLVADFNMEIGDSILYDNHEEYFRNWKVSAIDSLLINNEWRKKMTLTSEMVWYETIWLEGIGIVEGEMPFEVLCSEILDHVYEIYCYSVKDGNSYYPNADCEVKLTSSVNDLANRELIKIYPNPASSETIVTISSTANKTISLLNTQGDVLLLKEVTPGYKNYSLDLSAFSNGLYFIEVGNVSSKLIINR